VFFLADGPRALETPAVGTQMRSDRSSGACLLEAGRSTLSALSTSTLPEGRHEVLRQFCPAALIQTNIGLGASLCQGQYAWLAQTGSTHGDNGGDVLVDLHYVLLGRINEIGPDERSDAFDDDRRRMPPEAHIVISAQFARHGA